MPAGPTPILCVAEKPDAAKRISALLSNGQSNRREGFSKYNKIFEFNYVVPNFGPNPCRIMMTSVSGHMCNLEFPDNFRGWHTCRPAQLFDAPVEKKVSKDKQQICRTLTKEGKTAKGLIIWTDCDREGENIGYEVIDNVKKVNKNIQVYRAKFSEITGPSITRAINNLIRPNLNMSLAVDCRQELDLRIGAAFTRYQTLMLQPLFGALAQNVISYGSCQFPTLGFVVERWLANKRFVVEPFWKLEIEHTKNGIKSIFKWDRNKLFDQELCLALLELCENCCPAKITSVTKKQKSRWRPIAMDTILMEKLASQKLRMSAQQTMKVAEGLYNKGYLSYPRTETNIFPPSLNLSNLLDNLSQAPQYQEFINKIKTTWNGPHPRNGRKNDKAHPPIHPTKALDANSFSPQEKSLHDLISRHFLACISRDAVGAETKVNLAIGTETFHCEGLCILERNYLEIYPFDNWSNKQVGDYQSSEEIVPDLMQCLSGQTEAPHLLTESDLITLMDKNGIGTDATHAEHIEKIKERTYVGLKNNRYFIPSMLGLALVFGYTKMNHSLLQKFSAPNMRSNLEKSLVDIVEGRRTKEEVLREQLVVYQKAFEKADEMNFMLKSSLRFYMQLGQGDPRFLAPERGEYFPDFGENEDDSGLGSDNDGRGPGGGGGGSGRGGGGDSGGGPPGSGPSGSGGAMASTPSFGSAASDPSKFSNQIGNVDTTYSVKKDIKTCFECGAKMNLYKFLPSEKFSFLCNGCMSVISCTGFEGDFLIFILTNLKFLNFFVSVQ